MARIGPIVPKGWRLKAPEQFDSGWRLGIESLEDPILSSSVWNPDLEVAINMLADEINRHHRPKN